ncbi:MAG: imm11 family protein [Verrucomicrobiales bacterium]
MSTEIYTLLSQADKGLALASDLEYFQSHFVGKPMRNTWCPPGIEILNHRKPVRDFVSWMLTAPVVSKRAKECLEDFLTDTVEFLPLMKVKRVQLYAINVINVIDCLDVGRSEVHYDSATGKSIVNVHRFSFFMERIPPDARIFKVPEDTGSVFVFQNFIDKVIKHQLTGSLLQNPASNPFSVILDPGPDVIVPF